MTTLNFILLLRSSWDTWILVHSPTVGAGKLKRKLWSLLKAVVTSRPHLGWKDTAGVLYPYVPQFSPVVINYYDNADHNEDENDDA